MRELPPLAAVALLALACAHTLELPTPPAPAPPAPERAGPPAALEYIGVSFDGRPNNVSDELVLRIVTSLRKSGLFAAVLEPAVSHEAPPEALRLWLTVEQHEQLEGIWSGALKELLAVYSLGLLAPVFPNHYGYDVRLAASFEASDGWQRRYEGRANGSARYPAFLSEPRRVGVETRAAVLARALDWLVYEMARDAELARRRAPR